MKPLNRLEFKLLKSYSAIAHGVFDRHGGVSVAPYSSLNVSYSGGDAPESVKENRERICRNLGLDHLILPRLVHGIDVARITAENKEEIPCADAVFTTEKGVALTISHADCQAALFYDPVHQAVAAVHSGWRGSVQNIYAVLIQRMKEEIGTRPEDLIACISPSLGPDHSEFIHYERELPKEFWAFQHKPLHFDFWEISKKQLVDCGVREKNIEIAKICTVCEVRNYFSYRSEKLTGRNATVIGMRKD